MNNTRLVDEDGLERNFCVNTLGKNTLHMRIAPPGTLKLLLFANTGTYILTSRLVPVLEKSSRPQVVSYKLGGVTCDTCVSHVCVHVCVSHVCVQVTVTSGGMLLVKLDPNDLQFEHFTNFDGTFAYAQNKVCCICIHTHTCTYARCVFMQRQQVVMGRSSPQHPFLLHAPRLGRHSW